MNAGSSVYQNTLLFCRHLGFSPNIVLQSEDPFYIRKCVELGLGVAFVPALTWRGQFSDQVELRKMGDYVREVCLYRRPESRAHQYAADPSCRIFFALIKDVPIGLCILKEAESGGEILILSVFPAFRRQGIESASYQIQKLFRSCGRCAAALPDVS